jgi:ABC-type multidrug transport system fused ATPase/permease subunit
MVGMARESSTAARLYQERSERFAHERDRCTARSRWIAHARLIAFLAAGGTLFWQLEPGARVSLPWLATVIVLALLFVVLVVHHNELKRRCDWFDRLSKLNEEGLSRIARDWGALPDWEYGAPDPEHPIVADLDLFGRASLSSLLSTVGTPQGSAKLCTYLMEPAASAIVQDRQAAAAELATLIDAREAITVRGRLMPKTTSGNVERFLGWAEGDPWLTSRRGLVCTSRLLPLVAASLIVLNAAGAVPYVTWAIALTVNLFVSFTAGRKLHEAFNRAFARESAFQQYAELFQLLSTTSFTAPLLTRSQSELTAGGLAAHTQMQRLHRLVGLSEIRYSMLYVPIQALTLWDFHVLHRLERWQQAAGRRVRPWLEALGVVDALAALSTLRFENPDWAFPEVTDGDPPMLEAQGLGHPLLSDDVRVVNDVSVGPPGSFLLITGSNMSGKSTLLRAIGVNVVLARAGAPVCASAMRLPPVQLESSMRVHDSLQQGLSHFRAELERLKGVVEAARRVTSDGSGAMLYLLDDIFQGTNTVERQIAARKVISHLLGTHAIGAVTSHDLQLAETDELSAACVPVHFRETIEEGSEGPIISFDYKLRAGIATSRNALKLLEIVGLADGEPGGREADPDRRQE